MSADVTLSEFLTARLAEEDAAARRLLRYAQENELACGEPQMLGRRIPGWHEWPDVQAMCTRVLADVEAKRRVLARATRDDIDPGDMCAVAAYDEAEHIVCILAEAYADHPDYDEEWRP